MSKSIRFSRYENQAAMERLAEERKKRRTQIFNEIFTKAQNEAIYAVICNPEILYAYNANLTVPAFVLEGYYYVNQFSWA